MTRSVSASFAGLSLLALVALAGCSSGGSFDGTVEVKDNAFDPDTVTIDAGTELHFEVAASAGNPHTITVHKAGDPTTTLLLDETASAGEDVHFDFSSAGTYHVWCRFHGTMTSGMAMLVTVE